MKYPLEIVDVAKQNTYKGWSEGVVAHARSPRELMGCAGVHSTCNATNKGPSEYIPAFFPRKDTKYYEYGYDLGIK